MNDDRRARRPWWKRPAVIGYLFLALGVGLGFGRVQQIVDRQHDSDVRQLETIRTILCLAEHQVSTSKQRSPQEKATAFAFYQDALRTIHARPCDPR